MKGICSFILIMTVINVANGAYEELCARFIEGMKFREPENCHAYVTCENGVGTVTTCPNGQFYDKAKGCVATLNDPYCKNPCEGKDGDWVEHRTSCTGWYYCASGESLYGECDNGLHFNVTNKMCIYEEESDCSGVQDFCGILPTGATYSSLQKCDEYYACPSKGATRETCKKNLYYDVSVGKCLDKGTVRCDVHPIADDLCGSDSKPIADKTVPDRATCRGYYYCAYKGEKFADKNPAWHQCPEGLFYDADTQSCADPPTVRCTYNRCEGRGNMYSVADTWGCRYYHECIDGKPSEPIRCPWDMFFNERLQACTYNEVSDPACDYERKS